MSFRITNRIREAQQALDRKKEQALTAIGLYLVSQIKLLTPVDTGNLRNSITFQAFNNKALVQVGTNVEYAINVEKGTSKQSAQPYLTPGVENNINEVNRIIRRIYGD